MHVGAGTRKLQDILVDAKVPRSERDALPLVFVGETLAWVPGIALDRSLLAQPGEPCVAVYLTASAQRSQRFDARKREGGSRSLQQHVSGFGEAPGSAQNPVLESPNLVRGELLT